MGESYNWQDPLHVCALCGARPSPEETFILYGIDVCVDCRWALSKRRQAAFVVDVALFAATGFVSEFLYHAAGGGPELPGWAGPVLLLLFLLKDGCRGMSPGKWLFGVQVLDEVTLRPAGAWASLKRNLVFLLSVIGVFLVAMDVHRGRRWGDGWAGTAVIWRRYADRMPRERPLTICRKCGYDLTGNLSGICPECSTVIPDHDRKNIAAKGLPSAAPQSA
jgi:uncharacterized RDD family membrane protein YckC